MKIELKEFLKSNAEDVNNDGRVITSENFLLPREVRTPTEIELTFSELRINRRLTAVWEHLFKKHG